MTDLTVPTPPVLATIANVELAQTGTWQLKSGPTTFTPNDFVSAVAALDCPAVHNPIVKIGHTDPRFDGEPAVGWIGNMASVDDDRTLVGDYKGVPGWLAEILPAAWPQRSVEGEFDFRCQMGHTHPFVITAVALLGVNQPGVGTIASLQDVADLYGVVAAHAPTGTPVTVLASERTPMPNPRPLQVAATVTSDDVRRAFYESPIGSDWDAWIEEIQLDPMQIIYIDDDEGVRYRVPVTLGSGDGVDAVTFGEPVRVVIRYDDAPQVAAGSAPAVVRFASRAESRPGAAPATPQAPAASTGSGSTPTEGSPAVAFSDEQLTTLRQRLGVTDDADETVILAALDEALTERADPPAAPTTPPAPPTLPEGTVAVDADQLAALQVAASAGQEARAEQLRTRRETLVSAAVADGRVAPARRDHWLAQLEADPGVETVLASLAPVVPVTPAGYSATGDEESSEFDHLFPPTAKEA
ncbi:MAG TPA: phage protease [Amycolatopsis sp.]|nr:phage protease [Amycolatopsis sp.]